MYERVFSKRYLNNSKTFERHIRAIMLSLIRKYFIKINEDLDDDEVLNEVGIEKTTIELHIKDNIQFELKGKNIDLASFVYGITLNSQTIKELKLENYCFDKVISVENNVDIMKKYNGYCEKINDEKYILKLKKLLDDNDIEELHDLIKFVIDNKFTLEQESFIL